ncbi:toxin ParE1/3/4 [Tessaracoccus flavus]|nr:toxin ParE1/3/4 [Tessaracoccus flavus]
MAQCEGLEVFPHRGTMRNDIRPGLRTSSYKKRAVIATFVDDEAEQTTILDVFHGGHDYDTILSGFDHA